MTSGKFWKNAEDENQTVIHFLQLNLAHRLGAHEALMAWLHTQKELWILCIQEPYFTQKGMTKLPINYGAFWNDKNRQGNRKARAAIISPKGLKGYMVTQYSNMDLVTIRFEKLGITVISGYFPSDTDIGKSMELILGEVNNRKNVICCVDGNAYHSRWGSNHRKNLGWRGRHRGIQLIEMIDENDLLICNQPPHLATYVRDSVVKNESHIDITLCTYSLFNHIDGWRVTDETYMSDHRAIVFKYKGCAQDKGVVIDQIEHGIPWKKPPTEMKRVMEKALMTTVSGEVRLRNVQDVNQFISKHCTRIRQVLEKVFKKRKKHNSQVFWWTKEVAAVYYKLRLARRRMRRYKHQNLRQEFVMCRKEFREVVRKAKTDAWKAFTSEIGDPWSKLLKIVKATSVGKILSRTLHDLDGVYATDLSDTLVLLGKQFYPEPDIKMEFHVTIENEVNKALMNYHTGPKITVYELRIALRQMSASTAPGFDTITNNVIQCLATKPDIEQTYLEMYNLCLTNSYFPQLWKKAKVVLIPKHNTESNSTKTFRPISLTSAYAKLFKRIILARILHYLTLSNSLSNNQHVYQKGRSTQTALFEVFDIVQYALHRGRGEKTVCVVVFLDITGAFDCTWHYGILHKLLQYEVPAYLIAFLKSFLCNRTAFFMDSDVLYEVNLAQGCPQGGVLSPILWNVLFNEMLALPVYSGGMKQNRLKVVGYADDAAIVCKARTVEEASILINMCYKLETR